MCQQWEGERKVFAFAQERSLDINPSLCMMDFKVANMNAIWLLPRNAQGNGCLFYFSQSQWWKICSLGVTWKYMTVENDSHKGASILFGFPFLLLENGN